MWNYLVKERFGASLFYIKINNFEVIQIINNCWLSTQSIAKEKKKPIKFTLFTLVMYFHTFFIERIRMKYVLNGGLSWFSCKG